MSQQMKKLAEKSHLLVVTLMSPESHRIMRPVSVHTERLQRKERRGGGGIKGCTELQMTVHYIK